MATIHQPLPTGPVTTPFPIYEDKAPPELTEVEVYDGEESFHSQVEHSGPDNMIPSIEVYEQDHRHEQDSDGDTNEEPRPYSSSYTTRPPPSILTSGRRMSGVTSTSFISSIPSEMPISSKPISPAGLGLDGANYPPRKERPLFRNPASVRAMQMASPPPFQPYKLPTPSRSGRSDTSRQSFGSHRGVPHRTSQEYLRAARERSPRPTTAPHPTSTSPYAQSQSSQNLPLVLLHVTILPMQRPYSHELMLKTMPPWLVQNYKLLDEKLQDVVLMRRGLLIPHPHDEYDLLEERILESLELKMPRLSKCGHFVRPTDEEDEDEESDDDDERSFCDEQDGCGRDTSMSGGTVTGDGEETDTGEFCADCHRPVRKPGKGIGAGTKKWDIKIYAANGLMRAGAWSAAWREMERCDVEIAPWIPEDVKLQLAERAEEEEEAERQKMLYDAELQRLAQEEESRAKQLEMEAKEKKQLQDEIWERLEEERQIRAEEDKAKETKLSQALNEKIEEVKEAIRLEFETQALVESDIVAERFRALEDKLQSLEQNAAALVLEAAADPPVPTNSESPRKTPPRRQRSLSRPRSFRRQQPESISLTQALKNYLLLLAWEQKNLLIVVFTGLLAYFVMNPDISQHINMTSLARLPTVRFGDSPPASLVVVTDTATLTTTSTAIATTTVTQVAYHTIVAPLPANKLSTETSVPLDIEAANDISQASEAVEADVESASMNIPERTLKNQQDQDLLSVESPSFGEQVLSSTIFNEAETASAQEEPAVDFDAWITPGVIDEPHESPETSPVEEMPVLRAEDSDVMSSEPPALAKASRDVLESHHDTGAEVEPLMAEGSYGVARDVLSQSQEHIATDSGKESEGEDEGTSEAEGAQSSARVAKVLEHHDTHHDGSVTFDFGEVEVSSQQLLAAVSEVCLAREESLFAHECPSSLLL